ncbi:MAG TPA: hypothetical protein VES66_03530 [Terriglobales bacterium]|nr:hypothetical protein [Terriglobales bacterium]
MEKEREPRPGAAREAVARNARNHLTSCSEVEFLALLKKAKVPPYGLSPFPNLLPSAHALGSHNFRPDGLAASPRRKRSKVLAAQFQQSLVGEAPVAT